VSGTQVTNQTTKSPSYFQKRDGKLKLAFITNKGQEILGPDVNMGAITIKLTGVRDFHLRIF